MESQGVFEVARGAKLRQSWPDAALTSIQGNLLLLKLSARQPCGKRESWLT
jgi:hypothetical protein